MPTFHGLYLNSLIVACIIYIKKNKFSKEKIFNCWICMWTIVLAAVNIFMVNPNNPFWKHKDKICRKWIKAKVKHVLVIISWFSFWFSNELINIYLLKFKLILWYTATSSCALTSRQCTYRRWSGLYNRTYPVEYNVCNSQSDKYLKKTKHMQHN